MDVVLVLLFLLISSLATLFGYKFKNPGLGGIGAIGFVITGLAFITTGLDTQSTYAVQTNVSAIDNYTYLFNATYNSSLVGNVTSSINKTTTQGFTYLNQVDNNTVLFALLTIFAGLAIGFDAFLAWRTPKDEVEQNE